MRFVVERVRYMPKELQSYTLYVSEEFHTAAHLCACGCGTKIRTPLGPTEWAIEEGAGGPTMWPSVGNWQQACRSHYWFHDGEVIWGEAWSPVEIAGGRAQEQRRRRAYYEALYPEGRSRKLLNWVTRFFGRRRS